MFPQTILAVPFTVKLVPLPVTVRVCPSSVLWVPASWFGASLPEITWYWRIFFSWLGLASKLLRSPAGILANASLVGAKTVAFGIWLRVSVSPAALSAATTPASAGLLAAAVATGWLAM